MAYTPSELDLLSSSRDLDTFEYNLDYFSGAQAAVYIENVLVDEVTSLQWTVQQSKIPIYGYASQTFDEMANGTIIVQGSFSINFTHSGYLWSILKNRHNPTVFNANKKLVDEITYLNVRDRVQSQDTKAAKDRVDEIESYMLLLNELRDNNVTTGNVTKQINDVVWGPDNSEKRADMGFGHELRTDRRILNGFDIYLEFMHDGSEIATVRKIENVHLIGKGQTVVIDENPVQEVYSFYAKNVI